MMIMVVVVGFPWGEVQYLVALRTQRQFVLGSPEPGQDSGWPVLPIEQARGPPAAK